jgi:AMMECR1 domain-containing protein
MDLRIEDQGAAAARSLSAQAAREDDTVRELSLEELPRVVGGVETVEW